jgi:large subunit ribosomal protein L19
MTELIDTLERGQERQVPDFRIGDRVRVHFQVVEGSRRRTQVFEGVVLKEKGGGPQRTFTVRKLSFGVGVERTFPVHSPKIERIEVVGRGEVRRAKLYYLRGRVGRRARLREMRDFRPEDVGLVGTAAGDGAPAEGVEGQAEGEPVAAAEPEAAAEAAEAPEGEATEAPEAESAEAPEAAEAPEPEAPESPEAESEAPESEAPESEAPESDQQQAPAEGDEQDQPA